MDPTNKAPAPGVYWHRTSFTNRATGKVTRTGWNLAIVSETHLLFPPQGRETRKRFESIAAPLPDEWVRIDPPAV